MANGKGSALAIIAFIIGAGGLGIGIYSMFFSTPDVIALWEEMEGSGENFNVAFSDPQFSHGNYYSISVDNTSFTLTRAGWYKFNFKTTLTSLTNTDRYYCILRKNGATAVVLAYYDLPEDAYGSIDATAYVQSDGDDIFLFNCYCLAADLFNIAANQDYNQLSLEFME